jgi:hypothetical protein
MYLLKRLDRLVLEPKPSSKKEVPLLQKVLDTVTNHRMNTQFVDNLCIYWGGLSDSRFNLVRLLFFFGAFGSTSSSLLFFLPLLLGHTRTQNRALLW